MMIDGAAALTAVAPSLADKRIAQQGTGEKIFSDSRDAELLAVAFIRSGYEWTNESDRRTSDPFPLILRQATMMLYCGPAAAAARA